MDQSPVGDECFGVSGPGSKGSRPGPEVGGPGSGRRSSATSSGSRPIAPTPGCPSALPTAVDTRPSVSRGSVSLRVPPTSHRHRVPDPDGGRVEWRSYQDAPANVISFSRRTGTRLDLRSSKRARSSTSLSVRSSSFFLAAPCDRYRSITLCSTAYLVPTPSEHPLLCRRPTHPPEAPDAASGTPPPGPVPSPVSQSHRLRPEWTEGADVVLLDQSQVRVVDRLGDLYPSAQPPDLVVV